MNHNFWKIMCPKIKVKIYINICPLIFNKSVKGNKTLAIYKIIGRKMNNYTS